MTRTSLLRLALAAVFLIVAPDARTQTKTIQPTNEPKVQTQPGVEIKLSDMKTPLVFEPNLGQANSEFPWIGRGAGFRVGINSDGATLEFRDRATHSAIAAFVCQCS